MHPLQKSGNQCLPVMKCPEEYPLSHDWFSDVYPTKRFVASSAQVFYREFSHEVGTQGIILQLRRSDLERHCSSVSPVFGIESPPLALVLEHLETALERISADRAVRGGATGTVRAVPLFF